MTRARKNDNEKKDEKAFVVTVYEIHKQRVRIKARDASVALYEVRNGDGEYELKNGTYLTEFVEVHDGMALEVEREDDAAPWNADDTDAILVTEPVPDSKLLKLVSTSKLAFVTEAQVMAAEAQLEEPDRDDPDKDEWQWWQDSLKETES